MSVFRSRCRDCGGPMPRPTRTGRPRVRCGRCAADRAALGKAWRAAHPRQVSTYNACRRREYASHRRAINAARRRDYPANREQINARRRVLYAARRTRAIEERAFESSLRLVRATRLHRRIAKEEGSRT